MSIQFRFPPGAFVKHDGIKLFDAQAAGHVERKLKEKRDKPVACKSPSAPLRDDHIVLLAVDVLVALYAAFRKWRNHRRTLRALDELDEHQLRDIGLRREQVSNSILGSALTRSTIHSPELMIPSGPTETKSGLLQTPG